MDELMNVLGRVPVLAGLSPAHLERLGALVRIQEHPEGETIVREGDLGRDMYVIMAGSVRIEKTRLDASARPVTIATLAVGACFGEMALIDIQPRSASVVTLQPTRLCCLGTGEFLALADWDLSAYTLIIMNVAREISRRLRQVNQRLAELGDRLAPEPRTEDCPIIRSELLVL